MSQKVSSKRSIISLIQEVNAIGQHRIVIVKEGIPSHSGWFEHHTIAVFGKYRGSLTGNAAFPQGIFTVTPVASEVL
jgi:hypothetical protein